MIDMMLRRPRFADAFQRTMEREATAQTKRLSREADRLGISDPRLTIEIHGERRAEAYMKIGWQPISQTHEAQQWGSFTVQVPIFTLQVIRW